MSSSDHSSIEHHLDILRKQGFRVTPIVVSVLAHLSKSCQVRTALQIREEISSVLGFEVGNPTVYRICERLKQAGVLLSMYSKDGIMRYYVCCSRENREHLHFICQICMKVQKIDFCIEKQIHQLVKARLKAEVQSHFVQIEGVCESCRS
jgi:Fe2+ or Zn2+ uptake regulation protein